MIDVLQQRVAPEVFRDAIVLVGERGTIFQDEHFSPVSTRVKMPGVEFHAHVIDSLIQKRFLRSISSEMFWISAIILLIAGSWFVYTSSLTTSFISTLLYTCVVIIFGRFLLLVEGVMINAFAYCIGGWAVFVVTYLYKYFVVNKDRRFIQQAFAKYIDPELVTRIADDGGLELGGEARQITILFSDIANFTTLSESLAPQDLFALLSEYLSAMTDVLIENQ